MAQVAMAAMAAAERAPVSAAAAAAGLPPEMVQPGRRARGGQDMEIASPQMEKRAEPERTAMTGVSAEMWSFSAEETSLASLWLPF